MYCVSHKFCKFLQFSAKPSQDWKLKFFEFLLNRISSIGIWKSDISQFPTQITAALSDHHRRFQYSWDRVEKVLFKSGTHKSKSISPESRESTFIHVFAANCWYAWNVSRIRRMLFLSIIWTCEVWILWVVSTACETKTWNNIGWRKLNDRCAFFNNYLCGGKALHRQWNKIFQVSFTSHQHILFKLWFHLLLIPLIKLKLCKLE